MNGSSLPVAVIGTLDEGDFEAVKSEAEGAIGVTSAEGSVDTFLRGV